MPATPCSRSIASTRPETWPRRQVDLARIAGDDHPRVLAEPGEEHLHLHRRGVLRLVEDDDGVGQRAAAHEGERRDLDHAGLQAALDLVGRHHVVERVVERAKIGIDLLAHVAGQEAEPLAGLDRRARQDDPLRRAALDHRRGIGDGEIGLAGAGRADAEDQLGPIEGADIGVLHHGARHDRAPPRRDLGHRQAAARLERRQAELLPRPPRPCGWRPRRRRGRGRGPPAAGRRAGRASGGRGCRPRWCRGSSPDCRAATASTPSRCSIRARLRSNSPNSEAISRLSSKATTMCAVVAGDRRGGCRRAVRVKRLPPRPDDPSRPCRRAGRTGCSSRHR